MNYSTTTTHSPAILPSLSLRIRKISQRARTEFNAKHAKVNADLQDMADQVGTFQNEVEETNKIAALEPCACKEHEHTPIDLGPDRKDTADRCSLCKCRAPQYRDNLLEELGDAYQKYEGQRRDVYYPALIRTFVAEASGMEIDGKPVTVETLFDLPDAVIDDIGAEIDRLTRMKAEEALGFAGPTIGSAADGGRPEQTSAPTSGTAESAG